MAHIAVFPMPEQGHVFPVLGLLAELVRRGHQVTVPATARFAEAVTSTGAVAVPYETTMPDVLPVELFDAARLAFAETVATLPVLEKAYADDPPDLVLWDVGAWSGGLLARKIGVPDIQLATILSSSHKWSLGQSAVAIDWGRPEVLRFFTDVHALVGSPLPEFMALTRRRIALYTREFQYEGDSFDDRFVFAGPCLTDRSFQGDWTPPPDDRPVVFASLTGHERECVQAFRGLPWHLVVVGRDPGDLPPNVEVHETVPQLKVLARANAFLTNAGMSGVMEATVHGVPMIAVPRMADQRLNALRVEELGLGMMLDSVTPDSLRSLVHQVMTDPAICARVKDMQTITQSAGGAAGAADAVEAEL